MREIADAALLLFESQGVRATTVDDIAEQAGVAQRTFFRYAPTKEHAVFSDDRGWETAIAVTLARTAEGVPLAAALEQGWLAEVTAFDAKPRTEHERALRLRRLALNEPDLLAITLARDETHVSELAEAAAQISGNDLLTSRCIVALVSTLVRQAFDEWARRAVNGDEVSVQSLYLEARTGLTAVLDGWDIAPS